METVPFISIFELETYAAVSANGKKLVILFSNHVSYNRAVVSERECKQKIQHALEISKNAYILLTDSSEIEIAVFLKDVKKYICTEKFDLTLIFPYLEPPRISERVDGYVSKLLVGKTLINEIINTSWEKDFNQIVYAITTKALSKNPSLTLDIYQLGFIRKQQPTAKISNQLLSEALLIIPHIGSIALLDRCINHLKNIINLPAEINICFDDLIPPEFNYPNLQDLSANTNVFLNNPTNVGPYVARDHAIINCAKKYIFFQDSDDLMIRNRFVNQINYLAANKYDMVGCHELRIDEIQQKIVIVRFPIDVNEALLSSRGFHSLLHPTALISRKAYLQAGGFSTDRKFGYDTQFLLRSAFYLKMGNLDDFLYVRFRRENSLTTSPDTMIGSNLRNFLLRRWLIDYRLVQENKLDLLSSSLKPYKYLKTFEMQRIFPGL